MCAVLQTLSFLGRETARIVLHSPCIVCRGELPWRARTASCCTACWRALPKIVTAKCRSCAEPWTAGAPHDDYFCGGCFVDPLPLDWCDAWGHYQGGLEQVIHAFKFERHDFLDAPLATLLEETLAARGDVAFDAIVPVPMHAAKRRRRGYDQAELLAQALAKRVGIDWESLLTKRSDTPAQSKLARDARARNVRDAYAASAQAKDRSLLLVDDVCTTGETLRATARALLRAGAARVCAITIAKAG